MPWVYVELCTRYKVKKNLFWGESWLPLRNARTRVRLLHLLEATCYMLYSTNQSRPLEHMYPSWDNFSFFFTTLDYNRLLLFDTTFDYLRLHDTFWDYLRLLETTWDYLSFLETTWDNFETRLSLFETTWIYLRLFETTWDYLRLFESVRDNYE